MKNPFQHILEPLDGKDPKQQFYNLKKLGDPRYGNYNSSLIADINPLVAQVAHMKLFKEMYLEKFIVHLFLRSSAVLHPGPSGVCCQEL